MENFPWTRLANVELPAEQKPMSDLDTIRQLDPKALRALLKDGNWGGVYQRADEEMMQIWRVAIDETRELLGSGWAS
jgi:creatinine amidohydrolase